VVALARERTGLRRIENAPEPVERLIADRRQRAIDRSGIAAAV